MASLIERRSKRRQSLSEAPDKHTATMPPISVRLSDARKFTVECEFSWTVARFKSQIAREADMPPELQVRACSCMCRMYVSPVARMLCARGGGGRISAVCVQRSGWCTRGAC